MWRILLIIETKRHCRLISSMGLFCHTNNHNNNSNAALSPVKTITLRFPSALSPPFPAAVTDNYLDNYQCPAARLLSRTWD